MPITVAPDPNNPGGWIWVDRATGKPAIQPGGPGTPFVAESDLPNANQPKSPTAPAQTPANLLSEQNRILSSLGRSGWKVTGRTDATDKQTVYDQRTGQATTVLGPTGNEIWAITGPNGENDTVTVRPPGEGQGGMYQVVEPPKNLTAPRSQTVNGVVYEPNPSDPNGPWIAKTPSDPQQRLAEIAERERNQALTGHYATDKELLDYNAKANQTGADRAKAVREQVDFENTQKRLDAEEKRKAELFPGQLAQQGATLAGTQASTAATQASTAATRAGITQTEQNIEFAAQDQPGKLAQQAATLEGTQAATAASRQATQIAGAPKLEGGLQSPYLTTYDPKTGQVSQSGMNLAFQPKTQAEIAARVGQIQSIAQAKRQELSAQVDAKQITPEQANSQWQAWWNANVQSQIQGLEAAQNEAQFARTQAEQLARQNAMTTAQAAGTQAINAFQAAPRGAVRVGPNYERAMQAAGQGKFYGPEFEGAFTYKTQDPTALAQQATMESLKYISPGAAAATGAPMPNYQAINIPQALNQTNYAPFGAAAPPPPPAAPAAPVAPVAPAPPAPDWYSDWQARQAADIGQQVLARNLQNPMQWSQSMPNFGNPQLPPYVFGG